MINVDTEQHIVFIGPHGGLSVTQTLEAVKPAEDPLDSSDDKEPTAVASINLSNEGITMEVDYVNGEIVIFNENPNGYEDDEEWPTSPES